jgi:hypothetical protein
MTVIEASEIFQSWLLSGSTMTWDTTAFARKFDAYFFLDTTSWNSDDWRLSQFLGWFNNVEDRQGWCHVVGDDVLAFDVSRVIFDDFQSQYRRLPSSDAFQLWHGPTDRWGLVIDRRSGVAILGVDRSVESHVDLFFHDLKLPPGVAAERLGLDVAVVVEVYAPSRFLLQSSEENPMWTKFFFVCRVETEDDKLFYWAQFERFYEAVSNALDGFRYIRMLPDQALWRAVRNRRGEMIRVTGKDAPVGGWQAFTHANCEKAATKFLSNNRHLQLRFAGRNDEADVCFPLDQTGLPGFQFFWLRGSRATRRSPEEGADVYFVQSGPGGSAEQRYNQHFSLQVLTESIPVERVDRLVEQLRNIGHAEFVYRTERPARFWETNEQGIPRVSGIYSVDPDITHPDGSVEFRFSPWELVSPRMTG